MLLDRELAADVHRGIDAGAGDHQRAADDLDGIDSTRREYDVRRGGNGIRPVERDADRLDASVIIHGFQQDAHHSVSCGLRRGHPHKKRRAQQRDAAKQGNDPFHLLEFLLVYTDARVRVLSL